MSLILKSKTYTAVATTLRSLKIKYFTLKVLMKLICFMHLFEWSKYAKQVKIFKVIILKGTTEKICVIREK